MKGCMNTFHHIPMCCQKRIVIQGATVVGISIFSIGSINQQVYTYIYIYSAFHRVYI